MHKSLLGRFPVTNYRAAFTLIELLVVLAVLSTIGVGVVSFINPRSQFDKARDTKKQSDLKQLQQALDSYYSDKNCFPASLPTLAPQYIRVLPTPPEGGSYDYKREDGSCPKWSVVLAPQSRSTTAQCPSSITTGCFPTAYAGNYACVVSGNVVCPQATATPVPPTVASAPLPTAAAPTPIIDPVYGSGNDGDLIVSSTFNINTQTNGFHGRACSDGVVFNVSALTSNTATVTSNPSPSTGNCLKKYDEVLLMNIQGTSGAMDNVGNYEFLRVASVTSSGPPYTVTFSTSKTKFYGGASGDDSNIGTALTQQRVILQRVPNYQNVTIDIGAVLTANNWNLTVENPPRCGLSNGTQGGVLALKALSTVGILGDIRMDGSGYLGGRHGGASYSGGGANNHGQAGESFGGVDPFVTVVGGKTCGGADGGSTIQPANRGGGGSGQGTQSISSTLVTAGSGGGGNYGGTAINGTNGVINPTTLFGGAGGSQYGDSQLAKMFMGSGGGGGGSLNSSGDIAQAGSGGRGGGIIFIAGKNIVGSGVISSNGEKGYPGKRGIDSGGPYDSGSGGGGSGGTINIDANEFGLDNTQIQVNGGIGGVWNAAIAGNGGKGRARVDSTTTLFRGLVSYWKMDEASGVAVRDSNARNNGVSSSSTNVTTGKIGNARSFNGTSDYINIAHNASINISQGTLEAWVNPAALPTADNIMQILGKYGTSAGYAIWIYNNAGSIKFTSGWGIRPFRTSSINTPATNTWYHVVSTFDGTNTRLYINGVLNDTQADSAPTNTSALNIGRETDNIRYFNGTIDEVGIWSRALSSSEIAALYAAGNGKTYPLDPSSTVYLAASPASLAIGGGNFTVNWKNIQAPYNRDWIGLYSSSGVADSPKPSGWVYTSTCTTTVGTNGSTTGSCSFSAPSVIGSNYEFRLFSNDTYTRLAKSNTVSMTTCGGGNTNIYQIVDNLAQDVDHDGYYTGTASTQCVGNSNVYGGRTYYKDEFGNYTWLVASSGTAGDCDDTAASVYQTVSVKKDVDHDRYYLASFGTQDKCVGTANTGLIYGVSYYNDATSIGYPYIASANAYSADCYDSGSNAALANPGTVSYFSIPRGDGSYDYNCDGSIQYQYISSPRHGFFGVTRSIENYGVCNNNTSGYLYEQLLGESTPECGTTLNLFYSPLSRKIWSGDNCTGSMGHPDWINFGQLQTCH